MRKDDYVAAGEAPLDELAGRLVAAGKSVLYTPETVVVAPPPALFGPHLRQAFDYGRRRGGEVRRRGVRALRLTTLLPLALLLFLVAGPILIVAGGLPERSGSPGSGSTSSPCSRAGRSRLCASAGFASALLTVVGLVARHIVYAAGLVSGLVGRR